MTKRVILVATALAVLGLSGCYDNHPGRLGDYGGHHRHHGGDDGDGDGHHHRRGGYVGGGGGY